MLATPRSGRLARRLLLLTACVAAGVAWIPAAPAAAPQTPALYWSPIGSGAPATTFNFGSVEWAKQDFTLTNPTASATNMVTVSLNGYAKYAILLDDCSGHSLQPGEQCTVEVEYTPTPSLQADMAKLTAITPQSGDEASITLTGHALPSTALFASQGCSTWPVPALDPKVPEVAISAVGASGGENGGKGDGVSATLSAAGVETLYVCVDVGGGNTPTWTEGGGASGVSTGSTFANPVLVAGGGGSGGNGSQDGAGGDAGFPAGSPGQAVGTTKAGTGGNSRTRSGGAGGAGGPAPNPGYEPGHDGSAGTGFTAAGPGTGGSGGISPEDGGAGAGGGGYYGGGGGGFVALVSFSRAGYASGGGGGSDFCENTARVSGCTISSGQGTQQDAGPGPGEAKVRINYFAPAVGVVRSSPRCVGHAATLKGRAGGDRVSGTSGPDVIVTGRGNDRIGARQGNDLACAGPGRDRVVGEQGNDRIGAGPGRDRVFAGPGRDRVFARDRQRDLIDCGPGRDLAVVDRVDVTRRCELGR